MLHLALKLENPSWDRFDSLYSKSGNTPWKNKFWEVQAMKSDDIIAFDLRVTTKCDHAGVDLWLGLFGYSVNLQFYDSRHWNYDEGRYYIYNDAGEAK